MAALRAHHRGGPEVLVTERAPIPVPGPGEVLIEVHAAAITFDELTWPETWERGGRDRTPIIPSHEVSGVVAATADDVTEWGVGDEVFGLLRFDRDGAAAEYVTAPAADLALRPTSVSHAEAAALPLAGLTAWQALVDHAAVRPGQRVLVHGGAGGVGALTVQLAVLLGADVSTTVRSDAARDFASTLGASHVVDTRGQAFDAPDACYDVVIDTVGGDTLDRSFEIVCSGGKLVTLSAPPPPGKADAFEIDATFFIVEPDQAALRKLALYVDEATLHVAIARTYALADGRAAFESGRESGRRPGKTVLTIRT
ncbi:alcohol dehydrogenase [Mycobacterium sp. Root135]|uniref:NADP-dependent oxidoreductase n=1 Tax=Mycobacterium sp. Root135 TaxID=1736457 RepID=UPI0007019219|nr:NADP-dependent oxidoreductase [Mycobacterium sp. Root135]KQY07605.1 alcohol dehydrogenase [Mycobacterium sp. Root135]